MLRTYTLLLALVTPAHLSAADEKMFYTSEWTKLDEPGAKGRQMVVVIHNTPQGEYRATVKFVLGGEFAVAYSAKHRDGTSVDIDFLKPPGGNILRQPVRIKSVKWNGKAVPPEPVQEKKPAKAPDNDANKGKDKDEDRASSYLKFARKLADSDMTDKARERLREIVEKFPATKAAAEAKELLEKLPKK
jgi:hypothetical protein